MDKIVRLKNQSEEFIKAIKLHKGPLSNLFRNWAIRTNKATGSVRNAYYAIARRSREDKAFCDKYFDGKPLEVSKIVCFTEAEENMLISKINDGKKQGKSVRSIILSMAEGDAKKALRLQNKYRNFVAETVKKNPIITNNCDQNGTTELVKSLISEREFTAIKRSIDDMVKGITLSARRENEILKEKIYSLQLENLKLKSRLPQNPTKRFALDFFFDDGENSVN